MTALWVIGDSWTDPAYGNFAWGCGWPEQVAARLGLTLVNTGSGGSGYTRLGSFNVSHPVQAARGAGRGADAAVLWGSINDAVIGSPGGFVYDAATAALRMVRAALAPGAPILVYGPAGHDEGPVPIMYEHRDAVAQAAADTGAAFVDVLHWLEGRTDLVDAAHHPHCGGHDWLTDRIAPDVAWLLAARCADPPPNRPPEPGWPLPLDLDAAAA